MDTDYHNQGINIGCDYFSWEFRPRVRSVKLSNSAGIIVPNQLLYCLMQSAVLGKLTIWEHNENNISLHCWMQGAAPPSTPPPHGRQPAPTLPKKKNPPRNRRRRERLTEWASGACRPCLCPAVGWARIAHHARATGTPAKLVNRLRIALSQISLLRNQL